MTNQSQHVFLCPEFQFLICATRWPHDVDAIGEIQRSAKAIRDPQRLIALTQRHHVTGLVARALTYCDGVVSDKDRQELRDEALNLAEEQFRQLLQTRTAIAALRAQSIDVAVLKGTPCALWIYGKPGLRRSIDIDLLIARSDLHRASEILARIGYERSEPPIEASERHVRISTQYGKDWGFDYEDSDTGIELHWRLFQNPHLLGKIDVTAAINCEVMPGITLPVLPPAITMLYLVAHGAEHAWARLKWLGDLATLLRHEPANADELMKQAKEQELEHLTLAAILLCNELYNTALPQGDYRSIAKSWRTRKLLEVARSSLISTQDGTELEDVPMATTRKNMSHYLFANNPRFWSRELAYDLFHDAKDGVLRHVSDRILPRIAKVVRFPN